MGSTAAGSDEKKSYLLTQLKCVMIFHSCPIIFLTLNPAECHSPIALFYAGEKIDLESFDPALYSSEDTLKRMVDNPLAGVEYFPQHGHDYYREGAEGRSFWRTDTSLWYDRISGTTHPSHSFGGTPLAQWYMR